MHNFLFFFWGWTRKKSVAWRHRMSLNVWVKLMDCFLLLCPWPLLLPHSFPSPMQPLLSSPSIPDSLLSFSSSLVSTSLFTVSHPSPILLFCASGRRGTTDRINLTAVKQMYTTYTHTHAHVGDTSTELKSCLSVVNMMHVHEYTHNYRMVCVFRGVQHLHKSNSHSPGDTHRAVITTLLSKHRSGWPIYSLLVSATTWVYPC